MLGELNACEPPVPATRVHARAKPSKGHESHQLAAGNWSAALTIDNGHFKPF